MLNPACRSSRRSSAFAAALAARPAEEEPLTAARHALQSSILELHGSTGSVTAYLAAMRLIDSTPTLLAAYLRSVHDHDDEIIEVLARREGVDPVADRRPQVLAAVIGAMVFLANKDWQASDTEARKIWPPPSTPTPTPSSPPWPGTGLR